MTRECDAAQVKLYGKFWGTRQWAFDAVSKYLMDKIPGVRVVIEDESQLKVGSGFRVWVRVMVEDKSQLKVGSGFRVWVRVMVEDESQLKVGTWREHLKEGQTRFYTKCKQAVTRCISP